MSDSSDDTGQEPTIDANIVDSGGEETPPIRAPSTFGSVRPPVGRIGNYKLETRLGRGGMGEVWLGVHVENIDLKCAVKLIRTDRTDTGLVQRFQRERQALVQLRHENIVKIYDLGVTEAGMPYLLMEYVDGKTINAYCDENHLSVKERLKLFLQVCRAVQHAHGQGMIHRDLKPANVLVTEAEENGRGMPTAKVIDFGIARALEMSDEADIQTGIQRDRDAVLTQTGMFIGSVLYASPEQLLAKTVDTRTDVYSLGKILYQLLSGTLPVTNQEFQAMARETQTRVWERLASTPPERPSVKILTIAKSSPDQLALLASARGIEGRQFAGLLSGELDWIALKAIQKEPDRRYASVDRFAADIECYLADEVVEARPPNFKYRVGKIWRRNYLSITAAGVVLVALLTGLLTSVAFERKAEREAHRATNEANSAEHQRISAEQFAQVAEKQKEEAVRQKHEVDHQREEVERQRQAVKVSLSQMDFNEGERLLEEDKPNQALAFLARAARNTKHPGATARLVSLLCTHAWPIPVLPPLEHELPVEAVAYSVDGRRIITTCNGPSYAHDYYHEMRVWDAKSGTRIGKELIGGWGGGVELSPAAELAFYKGYDPGSDNGNQWVMLVIQTGDILWKWTPIASLEGYDVSWGGSEDKLAITTRDNLGSRVTIYEARTGKQIQTIFAQGRKIVRTVLDPKGRRIATLDKNGDITRWNLDSGQPEGTVTHIGKTGELVGSLYDSADGTVITASKRGEEELDGDDRTIDIRWIEGRTGSSIHPLSSIEATRLCKTFNAEKVVLSPDHRLAIVIDSLGVARAGNVAARTLLDYVPIKNKVRINDAVFSPDGECFATAGENGQAMVWSSPISPKPPIEMLHGNPGSGWVMFRGIFSADGKLIFTFDEDKGYIWSAETGKRLSERINHEEMRAAFFSKSGRSLVTLGSRGLVCYWGIPQGELVGKRVFGDSASNIHRDNSHILAVGPCFSNDETFVVTASRDGFVRVFESSSATMLLGPLKGDFDEAKEDGGDVVATAISRDGRLFAAGFGDPGSWARYGAAQVWDTITGKRVGFLMRQKTNVNSVAFNADGSKLLTTAGDQGARVWDIKTGNAIGKAMPTEGHGAAEQEELARFSPDGKRVVTIAGTVAQVWDSETGMALTEPMSHVEELNSARFSPDGRVIVTACGYNSSSVDFSRKAQGYAQIWDAETGKALSERLMHGDSVLYAEYSPDGSKLLTTSLDGKAKIWKVKAQNEFAKVSEIAETPLWLADIAEVVGGLSLSEQGVLEPTKDRVKKLHSIVDQMRSLPKNEYWRQFLTALVGVKTED